MVMNENHRFIITDTSFTKHPTAFQLKEIAKSAARIAKIFGWTPRVAMTSFATFGKPRLMNSKNVEDAVKLMDKDDSINFEYDGELNPEISLNWRKLREYEFSNLKAEANILVMPDKHSAGISVGLLKAVGNMDVIGSCIYGYNFPLQILNASMDAEDIYRISHICSAQAFARKEKRKMMQ